MCAGVMPAPVLFGSLTRKTGRCTPPPPPHIADIAALFALYRIASQRDLLQIEKICEKPLFGGEIRELNEKTLVKDRQRE